MDQFDVVLLAPPYYRVLGSHNNRAAVSLTYLSAYLEQAGISHVVYDADYTPAETFWGMRYMFDNYQPFVDAVDGNSGLYGEVTEIVMSFKPSAVVILGAEPLIATKDWANPFIAAHYARLLRALGVFTIGIGHFFTLDKQAFDGAFDCILSGEPSPAIVRRTAAPCTRVRRANSHPAQYRPQSQPFVPSTAAHRFRHDFIRVSLLMLLLPGTAVLHAA